MTPTLAADLAHGRPLPAVGQAGTYGVFAPDGGVLALVRERDGLARPAVVFAPAGADRVSGGPWPRLVACSGGVG